jgi:type I restriction enzyme S subunit
MKADRLLAHYEQIADTPDAIPHLRRFILDLAVRGKLVPQDPNDEPASELLKRILAEKARLKVKCLSAPLKSDEIPFELPIGWSWSRVGDICSKTGSGSTPRGGKEVYKSKGVPFLRSQNVYDDGLRLNDVAYIDLATHERMSGTRVMPGDLLLNITGGSMGRCCLVPSDFGDANVSQHVAIIRVALSGIEKFLHQLILSPYFQAFVFDEQTGAGRGGLPKNRMDMIVVPIPPLAEQKRIVAKVDELMGLCDHLETARAAREATRDRLMAASLARLNGPDPETFQSDARFALDALPALTKRPDQIKALRQTILNLAVRGKLLQQHASSLTQEVELESLVKVVRGSSPRPKGDPRYYGGSVPRLLIADITRDGKYVIPKLDTLTTEGAKLSRPMPKGSLVLAISGSYGVPAFLAIDACIHDGFIGFRDVSPKVDPEYLYLVMLFRRPYFDDVVKDSGLKNLTTEHLKRLVVPLPPLAEQHRIVAKVDELMDLCDQLETSLVTADETRRRLLESLLAEALAPIEGRAMEAAE